MNGPLLDSQNPPLGRHRTMHGRVVDWLGSRIVSGEFPDGSQLPNETDLAARLSVSKGGIREAVKALAAKGMVEPRPRTGTRVLPKQDWNLMDREVIAWHSRDLGFVRDLLELRLTVEPGAAALAAQRADAEQLDALEHAYTSMAEHAKGLPDTDEAFVAADLAFHLTLLRASGNLLIEQLGRVLEAGLHQGLEATSHLPGGVAATLPMHRQVLRAVRQGNGDAAARASRKLIEYTADSVRRMMSSR